jgi:hypothetical protein
LLIQNEFGQYPYHKKNIAYYGFIDQRF